MADGPVAAHQREYNNTSESIALDSYRGPEGLKRIHAQSSAETSGLGDSLQRIHALSSTETSGYGDGDYVYCGSPSPEYQGPIVGPSHHSSYDIRFKKNSPDSPRSREYHRTHSTENRKNYNGGKLTGNQLQIDSDQLSYVSSLTEKRLGYRRARSEETRSTYRTDGNPGKKPGYITIINVDSPGSSPGSYSQDIKDMSIDVEVRNMINGGCKTDNTDSGRGGGQGQHTGHNGQGNGIKKSGSLTSLTSNKSSSGYFLGKTAQSTWMTWSQDRRASFKRRMLSMEERQKELEENRVSTPVLKARKESVMFIRPGMEGTTLPSEDDLHVHERLQSYVPSAKARRRTEDKEEFKLSKDEWRALVTFWEHPMFIKCRWCGILLASCALMLTIICLTNQQWSLYQDHDFYGASHSGLWLICSSKLIGKNCTTSFEREWLGGEDASGHWQYAVIGLLIFSVAFGFLATMLAFCGICTTALPRKLYYYHSAGEIYFICALSVLAAVLIYPVAMESESQLTNHTFGLGYILSWVAVFIFLASSLCMCLDEIMRTATKGCLNIQRHSNV